MTLKKSSYRQKIINECLALIRERLKRERGDKCEICGRRANNIGLFHILSRAAHPRLMLNTYNILLACWFPCHSVWHHDYFNAPKIEKRIKELRGSNYKTQLLVLDKTSPKLTTAYLKMYLDELKLTQSLT